jgi:hypothetical protein
MKSFLKFISVVIVTLSFVACSDNSSTEGFSKSGKAGGLDVIYSSSKPLVIGDNTIDVKIMESGKEVTGATKVEFKVFMPEMPGMPYMESVKLMRPNGEFYSGNINFSMGGTWQVKIFIEKDGKKYKLSSSVII